MSAPRNIKARFEWGVAACSIEKPNGSRYGHSESRRDCKRDQQPIAWQVMIRAAGIDARHRCYLHPSDQFQCCILMLIGAPDGISMLSFISAMIHIVPTTTTNTMSRPKASASTLFVLSGPVVMCRKNTR